MVENWFADTDDAGRSGRSKELMTPETMKKVRKMILVKLQN